MKKISIFILLLLSSFMLLSCNDNGKDDNNIKEEVYKIIGDPFRLSSIVDETGEDGVASYAVFAPYTDTYTITCTKSSKIVVYDKNSIIKEGTTELNVSLKKGNTYGIRVETVNPKTSFKLHSKADNNLITLPYDVDTPIDISNISLENTGQNPTSSATVNYEKREGGTYIYSNNPELIPASYVGKAFIRNWDLTGDIFFTFEHANYSGSDIYLGYQLLNEGDTDVFITVTNIGFQAGGTWFGQFAWYDYYNTSFTLPEQYTNNMGAYGSYDYAYQNYSPRVFQPVTYRLPAGEYFYVIGGTTKDAYNNINIDDSADQVLENNRCSNGNVKFSVTGGSVTGTFYAYNDVAQVQANPEQTGYVTGSYSAQYSGIAYHEGVIDNHMSWVFNDSTKMGNLPVEYTTYYADNIPAVTTPYSEYMNTAHITTDAKSWMTHLNPQNDHRAVGMDIVEFNWVDAFGSPVKIDNLHADGGGHPANTANWMIEYQDHFTFINQGDNGRNVTLGLKDSGTLAIMLRDSKTGEVLSTYYTMGQANLNYSYQLYIPAHSAIQVTLQYVLVACSYGNVSHTVTLS